MRVTPVRTGISLAAILILAVGTQFWLHDAMPYIIDYTEESYRRYWPNRTSLLFHIAGGTVALFTGPFQLWSGLRRRFLRLHRWTGYAYLTGVAVGASASFSLAFYTLPDFGLALFILAVVWWLTIAMAFIAIRNRRIDAHAEWMARSYIVTFSFVTYRFLVALSPFDGLGPSRPAMVLWISWVVPMMLFELFINWDRVTPPRRRAAPVPPAGPS